MNLPQNMHVKLQRAPTNPVRVKSESSFSRKGHAMVKPRPPPNPDLLALCKIPFPPSAFLVPLLYPPPSISIIADVSAIARSGFKLRRSVEPADWLNAECEKEGRALSTPWVATRRLKEPPKAAQDKPDATVAMSHHGALAWRHPKLWLALYPAQSNTISAPNSDGYCVMTAGSERIYIGDETSLPASIETA
ncbi:hypothetical protein LXG23DRAFT_26961 [Yarrowia lipolytica]|uniref:Uncharacterized protein n=1 Tax=Yarrowia lipolytica TaxID=4952 RepID=A0A1D8N4K4_YARLL|nr:hypothetical protein YALI1_A12445g [Yarrowia lipolytica]KAB8280022.1 hypothetical protein BKA91DRAFT_164615 [Yarrowia lipolytica]KAE8168807.1 hypothetical protein BKA90DRAFT_156579 [Yarrowia lipolytica]KAJ8051610.1 hypothetical protein LXG23DRAFT_26961 [Yarrowia lipolytica]RMI95118.1 hypothetical protein BD777DRAFT_91956 [Yarrowia lipolytica]